MKKLLLLLLSAKILNIVAMQPESKQISNVATQEATSHGTSALQEKKLKAHVQKKKCILISILTCTCCCYPCYKKCCFSDNE